MLKGVHTTMHISYSTRSLKIQGTLFWEVLFNFSKYFEINDRFWLSVGNVMDLNSNMTVAVIYFYLFC